jgi:carbon dioxide concentrating mechanism protein CcmM
MVRKVTVPLLCVILALSLIACGSETAQEDDEKNTGSAPKETEQSEEGRLTRIGRPATPVFGSTYVSPLTEIYGDVFIGQESFVAMNSVFRAAPEEGVTIEFGDRSNVQDSVIVRALEEPVIIGDESSLTHHVTVRDSEIGDRVFVGYNAEVRNSRVGEGTFIYHGALVDGVEIPENSFVGPGEEVTDQSAADALPKVEDVDMDKYYDRKEHLDINKEFAKAYIELYEEQDYGALLDIGPNPKTSFNPEQVEPRVDETVELGEFERIVGDVEIGELSKLAPRTVIRADEGTPIVIGRGAIIRDRATFHALKDTDVQIGEYLVTGDDVVLHGPLEMGNNNVVADGAVVFRAKVGNNVQIGEGAVVAGPAGKGLTLEIPDDAIIPADAVVTSEEDLEALK